MDESLSKPTVSVVIPTFNCAHLLAYAIESVCRQTRADWEMIVVNNFSTDNTEELVYSFQDPRIKLINFSNGGVIAASRNKGILEARGDWVAFLDSDDTWMPEKLEECLRCVDQDFDLLAHDVYINQRLRISKLRRCRHVLSGTYRGMLYSPNSLTTSAVMVKRATLLRHGGFVEDANAVTAEDFDLWLRLAKGGGKFKFIERPLGTILILETSASRAIEKHLAACLFVTERHFNSLNSVKLWDLVLLRRSTAISLYGAGRSYASRNEYPQALQKYMKSLLTFPLYIKTYVASLLLILQTIFASKPTSER